MTSCQNTRKCHPGQKKKYGESAAAQEEMRKIREERFRQLSDKVDKNKLADAEAAELQGLQAGGQRRWSDACGGVVATVYRLVGESNGDLLAKGSMGPRRSGSISGADVRKRRRKKEQ